MVSDEGDLAMLSADGSELREWSVGGDLEAVAIVDDESDVIYLGDENPDAVIEFDWVSGRVLRRFDLTPWLTGASNQGLEALAFVPDDESAEGGYFYAGHQGEGRVYVFELPIVSSRTSVSVRTIGSFVPVSGRTDLAALDYDATREVLYAAYDGANRLTLLNADGTRISEMSLPQSDQEGFALSENCDAYIAQDSAPSVWKYTYSDP